MASAVPITPPADAQAGTEPTIHLTKEQFGLLASALGASNPRRTLADAAFEAVWHQTDGKKLGVLAVIAEVDRGLFLELQPRLFGDAKVRKNAAALAALEAIRDKIAGEAPAPVGVSDDMRVSGLGAGHNG